MRSASRACCRYLFFWRSSLRSGYSGRRAKLIGRNVATLKLRHCPRMGLVAQAASLLLSRTPIKPINVSQVVDALRRLVATPLANRENRSSQSRSKSYAIARARRPLSRYGDKAGRFNISGSCWMRPVSLPAIAAIALGRRAAPTTGSIDAAVLARTGSQGDPARPVERGLAMNSS
jgi:hypothetical protein